MKIKKILLSTLVFAVAAIVCTLTVGAEKAGDYQIYATGADTAAITSYSGTATSITIPSKLNGFKVTQIERNAFRGNTKLTKVTIPNTVTDISDGAFGDCTSLETVTIPDSVKSIGADVFENTKMLKKQSKSSTKYVGKWLVGANTGTLTVKNGTVGIADSACQTNYNIKTLNLPSGLKYIGSLSFAYCTGLKKANIPSSVERIGTYAFTGTAIVNNQLESADIAYIDKWVVDSFYEISNANITAGTVGIADSAFESTELRTVKLPSSLRIIGISAFSDTYLTTVSIPAGVTTIGIGAFSQNPYLKSVTVAGTNKNYSSQNGVLYNKNKTVLMQYPVAKTDKAFSVPSTVTVIDSVAFTDAKKLTSVTFPSSLKSLGEGAFGRASALTSVKFGANVKYIGAFAFIDCKSLTGVTLSSNLRDIDSMAFLNCDKLTKITVPKSVKNIMPYAIGYCFNADSNGDIYIKSGFTIYGYDGEAKRYANENNIKYVKLSDANVTAVSGFKCSSKTSTSVTLQWTKNSTASGYELQQYKNGKWVTVATPSASTTSYTVKSLKAGTAGYRFRIRAYKTVSGTKKYSSWSSEVKVNTNPYGVGGFSVKSKFSVSVTLQWNKGTTASGYELQQYKNGKWTTIYTADKATVTSYTVKNLKAGTAGYQFRIRAYKTYGTKKQYGSWSKVIKVNTNPYGVGGFSVKSKFSVSVTLQWNKGTTASGYELQQYKNGKWTTIYTADKATVTSYTVKNLKAGTAGYQFRIRAYKTYGTKKQYGSWSKVIKVNTNPYGVGGFEVKSTAKNSVTLQWNKGTTASGYVIEKWNGNKWVHVARITNASTTTYTVNGLKSNTSYQFKIRAFKSYSTGNQYGTWSTPLTAKTSK